MALAIIDDVKKYLDGCSCTRDTKGEMTLIRQQLEQKDAAIERLEDDIRRKDGEKDNLMKMQRDLQEQIAQISIALEAQAAESDVRAFDAIAAEARQVTAAGAQVLATASEVLAPAPAPVRPRAAPTEEERKAAAAKIEALARGRSHRMAIKRGDVDALADPDRAEKVSNIQKKKRASTRMQANFRGKAERDSLRRGEVPQRTPAEQAAVKARAEKRRAAELADAAARGVAPPPPEPADDEAYDDESVDSDYDVDDGAFANLGRELLSGPLKIAKVYGQDEPPAQEDELEWEVRYCILHDGGVFCHYDALQDGAPVGDRGMVRLSTLRTVEKVVGVDTFVIKGASKVYMLKLVPHDDALMRTWISALSQQLR